MCVMTALLLLAAVAIDGDLVEHAIGLVRLVLEHALPMRGREAHVLFFFLPIAQQLGALRSERMAEPSSSSARARSVAASAAS